MSETIAHDAINDERDTEITLLTAELERSRSAIFPYVSDLEEPLDVLIGGLGARYDMRGKVIDELRSMLAREKGEE